MKGKPKFRVGQVVAFKRQAYPHSPYFGKIRVVSLPEGGQLYNVDGFAVREEELRPLTAREAGRKRGKRG